MILFTQNIQVFLATIYGGILIGLLFDIHRCIKGNFKIIDSLSIIFDILFWAITTCLVFITINIVEYFDLRYYHFIALFFGFILYYNTISKPISFFINKIISITTKTIVRLTHITIAIINNLYYVIIYPIHLLFDIIIYIPNILMSFNRSVRRR